MNTLLVPEKRDWVYDKRHGRAKRWLQRKLRRPKPWFITGIVLGVALGMLGLPLLFIGG